MSAPIPQREQTPSGMRTRYVSTTEAYDLWASVYDTDGNFLQAMDTLEMRSLFPQMINEIKSPKPWKLIDLGCGTGRNTAALIGVPDAEIVAIDASPGMLEVAKKRLEEVSRLSTPQPRVNFEIVDLIQSSHPSRLASNADAIISTLVIEHIPCDNFFSYVSQSLNTGGILLLTNMHSEMGNRSQAGFVDEKSGEKIRPTSYAHTIDEVVQSAKKYGLEPISKIEERAVTEDLAKVLGERSRKYVGVTCWFGGLFRQVG